MSVLRELRPLLRLLRGALLLACAFAPTSATAQTAVEIAAARQWFKDAEQAERAGDCETAIEKFRKALSVKVTPQIELRIGACEEKLGRLASALAAYQAALSHAQESNLKAVVAVAKEQVVAVEPKVPEVRLQPAEAYDGLTITLDGEALSEEQWRSPLKLDPGRHEFKVEAPGKKPLALVVEARPTVQRTIPITLEPLAAPGADGAGSQAPKPAESDVVPYVLFGVSGAALVGGAVVYVLAAGRDGDIDDLCGGADRLACPQSQKDSIESDVASVDRLQGISFGLAGLALATGVVGVVLLSSGSDSPSDTAQAPLRITPVASQHSAELVFSGAF